MNGLSLSAPENTNLSWAVRLGAGLALWIVAYLVLEPGSA